MSWITSLSCSPPAGAGAGGWLRFIFLAPCPQRALFSLLDLLFLLTLLVFAIQKLLPRFLDRHNESRSDAAIPFLPKSSTSTAIRITWRFKLPLAISSLLAAAFLVLLILAALDSSTPRLIRSIFFLLQFLSHLSAAAVIAHEKRFRASSHPHTLRLFWLSSFVLSILLAGSAILRFLSSSTIIPDDIVSLVFLLFSAGLLAFAISPSTGIHFLSVSPSASSLTTESKNTVTCYVTASLLSRLTWAWMNPLLSKGYKSPLQLEDVPSLSPDHQSDRLYNLFASNWPDRKSVV